VSKIMAGPPGGVVRGAAPRWAGLGAATLVLAVVVVASVAWGSKAIPVGTVVGAFVGYDPGVADHLVVWSHRVPRTVIGLLVGVALGLAGVLMQGVTRNPLADPGLLGINAGAALFVVLAMRGTGVDTVFGYVWFAFAGAAAAAVVVYALGVAGRGGATPVRLALSGAALTSLLTALTAAILVRDAQALDQFRFWVVGSLAGRDAQVALQTAPFIVGGAVLALFAGRRLNALALGVDVARSLGQRVAWTRLSTVALVVLLAGAATAAAGPIAFVGLTVPHIARGLVGPDYRWILAYALVLSPILLLAADVAGRLVAGRAELEVGLITAVVGAPLFIALVRRRNLAAV
jgi:iron complex transport system permease protein